MKKDIIKELREILKVHYVISNVQGRCNYRKLIVLK